ncbi:MAG: hypothetical protein K2Y23_06645 [Cyanobacteria bacterium]|nr:hypothetical protein [Cyanobacteriota bacterium]
MRRHGPGTTAQSIDGTIAAVVSPAEPASAPPQLTVSARGVLLSWVERTGDKIRRR